MHYVSIYAFHFAIHKAKECFFSSLVPFAIETANHDISAHIKYFQYFLTHWYFSASQVIFLDPNYQLKKLL